MAGGLRGSHTALESGEARTVGQPRRGEPRSPPLAWAAVRVTPAGTAAQVLRRAHTPTEYSVVVAF